MKAKHTPGPWHHVGDGLVYTELTSNDDEAIFICDTGNSRAASSNEEERANAQLISAAPELLEALRALMALDVKGHALADRLPFSDAGRALLAQCRAAIARATTED
jgi:hypothetical protein